MVNNNSTQNTNHRLTILLVTGVLLVVVLILFININNKQIKISPSLSQLPSTQSTNSPNQITPNNIGDKMDKNNPSTITTLSMPPIDNDNKQSSESISNISQTSQNSSKGLAFVRCAVGVNKMCVIGPGDSFYTLLGKDPYTEKLLVNGSQISPDLIQFNINQEIYSDEPIKDASGKTIVSTKKEFNSLTNTLSLYIGINASYQQNLSPDQLQRLAIEQIVRSFFAMYSESPDNYVKIEQIIHKLNSWQPTE